MKINRYLCWIFAAAIMAALFHAPAGAQEGYPMGRAGEAADPALAPPLVPEGMLALELSRALSLGQAQNEAEAEDLLSAAGIEPKNGWIADYPVTPDVLGEIQDRAAAAADAGRLSVDREGALQAVANTAAGLGLSIAGAAPPASAGVYGQTPPPEAYSGSSSDSVPSAPSPQVVNNYYYSYGNPVVTYYPPPEPYTYLYAWVPYPFWYSSVYFPGFFILHDFHRTVRFHHRVFVVSNHFVHPGTRGVFRIDPANRARWGKGSFPRFSPRHFETPSARSGGRAIVGRSFQGARPQDPGPAHGITGNGSPPARHPASMGAGQQARPVQPGNRLLPGGTGVNRGPNGHPAPPAARVVKPIQPSVSPRPSQAGGAVPPGAQPRAFSRPEAPPAASGVPSGRSERSFGRSFAGPASSPGRVSAAPPSRPVSPPSVSRGSFFSAPGARGSGSLSRGMNSGSGGRGSFGMR